MADSSTKRHSSIISPMVKRSSFALLVLALACLAAAAQESDDRLTSETFGGLRFRSIGPAVTSGRVVDIAVHPDNRKIHYVAAASGGVWKTENSGTTWTPIFDDQPSYSIGCVRMDPNNPLVVWVGTGENNSQRSVSYGDGVYKSVGGGKSWKNMGLQSSEHIAKILVDPRDSDTVYVASQGPLWRAGGERGLYKTADGGETWTLVLEISENTGVTDFVMDPRDPGVLVAASYQRRRHVWTLIDGGPESALYKTTDGGENWEKLTRGLPKGDVGRIGLAQSPANPDVVYAIIEAEADASGVYRSIDAGSNWEKRNPHVSGSPQYYQELVADPKNPDRVYSMDTYMMVSEDGGKTFVRAGETFKHVDNHALWIDPENTDYLLVGCAGGVYESFDRGSSWHFKANLPLTQFYRASVDNDFPFYNVYGGTQDKTLASVPPCQRKPAVLSGAGGGPEEPRPSLLHGHVHDGERGRGQDFRACGRNVQACGQPRALDRPRGHGLPPRRLRRRRLRKLRSGDPRERCPRTASSTPTGS